MIGRVTIIAMGLVALGTVVAIGAPECKRSDLEIVERNCVALAPAPASIQYCYEDQGCKDRHNWAIDVMRSCVNAHEVAYLSKVHASVLEAQADRNIRDTYYP